MQRNTFLFAVQMVLAAYIIAITVLVIAAKLPFYTEIALDIFEVVLLAALIAIFFIIRKGNYGGSA